MNYKTSELNIEMIKMNLYITKPRFKDNSKILTNKVCRNSGTKSLI